MQARKHVSLLTLMVCLIPLAATACQDCMDSDGQKKQASIEEKDLKKDLEKVGLDRVDPVEDPYPNWGSYEDPMGRFTFRFLPFFNLFDMTADSLVFARKIEGRKELDLMPILRRVETLRSEKKLHRIIKESLEGYRDKPKFKLKLKERMPWKSQGEDFFFHMLLLTWREKGVSMRTKLYFFNDRSNVYILSYSAEEEKFKLLAGYFSQIVETLQSAIVGDDSAAAGSAGKSTDPLNK